MVATTVRNADLTDLTQLLREQHVRKIDMVVPATRLRSAEGMIQVTGVDPVIEDDGVTDPNGWYRPTAVFDEGIADRFGIPIGYVRRMRADRPDILDANLNGWIHGRKPLMRPAAVTGGEPTVLREMIPVDHRAFLFRAFRGGDQEGPGIARALLSDQFKVMDNLDVLMATLDGVRAAGVEAVVSGADLTERRMVVRIEAPEIRGLAPTLLRGYRSPFSGDSGDENPLVFAGLQIDNSETGDGAYRITPRLVVQICRNGMTITKDAMRAVHLGGRLDVGVIRWSEETEAKNLELVKAKTVDSVRTFLDQEYMEAKIAEIEEHADRPIEKVDEVKVLAKRLKYSEAEQDGILEHFVRGGQMTRGGLVNAITSFSQTLQDPDAAFAVEGRALEALTV